MKVTNKLHQRIFDISLTHNLSHLSSCISAVDLIDNVYSVKDKDEIFVLSNGHAALALYVVLEKYHRKNAEKLWEKHGTHPNRDLLNKIHVSSGSLGHGLPIAVGIAKTTDKNVYCLTSDGEWAEGSMWEALRVAGELGLSNLIILINANGFSGIGEVDVERLEWRIRAFMNGETPKIAFARTDNQYEFLEGVKGHYVKL